MSHAVEVLIVDEPPGFDPNFRATLEHTPALRTIGEDDLAPGAGDKTVALICVRDALLDTARERIASLRDDHPSLRILVVFQSLSADSLRLLLAAGADAFVGRQTPVRDVCGVILGLVGAVGDEASDAREKAFAAPDSLSLTPREAEVLRFLSAGFSNKEVARRLSLSVRTVETHRLNLRRKTQTGRLKDLVMLARQLGLDPVVDVDLPRRAAPH